jgi:hypothetical protein
MNVAIPTKDCLELIYELIVPVTKAREDRTLTRQEVSSKFSLYIIAKLGELGDKIAKH